ncbi:MAG: serine/threonine phosphatase [Elainellaceae cyanobacterium]
MIICPECRFENPDENRFCQECGVNLQPDRLLDNPLDSPRPQSNQLKLALIFARQPPQAGSEAESQPEDSAIASAMSQLCQPGNQLAERYVLQASRPRQERDDDIERFVVDTRPTDPPFLEVSLTDSNTTHSDSKSPEDGLESLLATFPPLVRTHLFLQDELYPTCPQVQDAWTADGYTALILEDRERLSPLSEGVRSAPVAQQVLHWLYDMIQLWSLLASQNCHQSLLVADNLRIDEDQILCLKRLYSNDPHQVYPLSRLGQLWRETFSDLPETLSGALSDLCPIFEALETGEITSLEDLNQRLETIEAGLKQPEADHSMPHNLLDHGPSSEGEQVADYPFDDGDDVDTVVLPMQLYSLSDAGYTDVGRLRKHNEDCFYIQTDIHKQDTPGGRTCSAKGLYILCDGMGGHASGEVASMMAVETLRKSLQSWTNQLPSETSLNESIRLANQAIYEQNQESEAQGSRRMGTTLVMLLVQGMQVAIAHVGDSRVYRVSRKFGLEQLTVDHEVGQREIHRGIAPEVAYARQDAYQLTQALGPRSQEYIRPDIQYLPVTEDAVFILASDGLTDNDLLEQHYESHLEPLLSSQTNLAQGVANLIGLANHHNGHDNITAIAVRLKLRPVLP